MITETILKLFFSLASLLSNLLSFLPDTPQWATDTWIYMLNLFKSMWGFITFVIPIDLLIPTVVFCFALHNGIKIYDWARWIINKFTGAD